MIAAPQTSPWESRTGVSVKPMVLSGSPRTPSRTSSARDSAARPSSVSSSSRATVRLEAKYFETGLSEGVARLALRTAENALRAGIEHHHLALGVDRDDPGTHRGENPLCCIGAVHHTPLSARFGVAPDLNPLPGRGSACLPARASRPP